MTQYTILLPAALFVWRSWFENRVGFIGTCGADNKIYWQGTNKNPARVWFRRNKKELICGK